MRPPTDPNLLHRAFSDGDDEAWAEIVRQYTPLIRQFSYSIGWREQHLDDLVQDVLVTLLEKRGEFRYDPRGKFRNYLFTIVKNVAFTLGRKIQRASAENGISAILESLAREDQGLLDAWEQQWRDHHKRRAYELVSRETDPKHWQVFLDIMVERLEPKAVAAKHGLSIDNVYQIKKRVSEAIQAQILRQIEDEDLPQ